MVGTAEDENIEGSRVGLVAGRPATPVQLLFQALVLQSGNDAANALARAAGGVDVTVAAMNETAEAMGAFDTVAGTPSGLDVAGQSSSPYDLALIFRALVADPAPLAVLRTPTAQMPAVDGPRPPATRSRTRTRCSTPTPAPSAGKTGFTDAARHTFVTAAERDGRRLVVSLMDTENRRCARRTRPPACSTGASPCRRRRAGVGRLVDAGEAAPAPASADDRRAAAHRRPGRPAARGRGGPAAPAFPAVPVPSPAPPCSSSPAPVARPPARRQAGTGAAAARAAPGTPLHRRSVAVHAAVKKANRATRLIQTSRPTAPPNADAVTLPEIRAR